MIGTAQIQTKNSFQKIRPFVEHELERLAGFKKNDEDENVRGEPNRAALSELRRVLGKPINTAFPAYKYLCKWTADFEESRHSESWDVKCYFLVASLFALYQQGTFKNENNRLSWHHEEEIYPADRNFGASFRRLELKMLEDKDDAETSKGKSKSLEKRFSVLLNSRSADLPVRLRQAVLLLKSYEIRIDWVELLRDLLRWKRNEKSFSTTNRRISPQRSWAQSFYKIEEIKEN
ncbi:MAG: type I-E CRISPR-associated protein Cse2/CasB [Pyrinomonadaceae bacterium]